MGIRRLLLLLLLRLELGHGAKFNTKFLIVSAPQRGEVAYTRTNKGSLRGDKMITLINSEAGLVHPMGLAVDHARNLLFVADPDARVVLAFSIRVHDGVLLVGKPVVCAHNVEARWVTVDGAGNIFFTDEQRNQILQVPPLSTKVVRWSLELARKTTRIQVDIPQPIVVYAGQSQEAVSKPSGIAADNFHLFWANKQAGNTVGSIVMAPEHPKEVEIGDHAKPLVHGADKFYGVCIAHDKVFYTQLQSSIYGIERKRCCQDSASPQLINNRLQNPRGCVYDGDGTVFVADRGANAVYQFAANMPVLTASYLTKAMDFDDAFGVTVYTLTAGSARRSPLLAGLLAAAACAAGLLA
mmetsp:Transcript_26534/g.76378  ORF Transcript_26534/g.76378 Transcript_26534/m.76378 type:complete len:354 (+) Transcript_26534:81-1142(+)